MKKAIYVLIAVVFAFALLACDSFTPPAATTGQDFNDDGLGPLQPGEFFVGLNRSGRALTGPLARAGADFFEVVFADEDNDRYERATFREGRLIRMRAPVIGDYDNSGDLKAYVFAGRNETKTLLGIGNIVRVNDGGGLAIGTEITATTTQVEFQLVPLTTDIKFAAPMTDSTFSIGGLGVAVADVPVGNHTIPVFIFPKASSGLTASFKFNIANPAGQNLFSSVIAAPVTIPLPPLTDPRITTREFILEDHEQPLSNITATWVATAITSGEIDVQMSVVSDDKDGLCLMYIDIPVYLLDGPGGNSPNAVTWRLRGGLSNTLVDAGATHNNGDGSLGGAVVIGVGNVFEGAGFDIIVLP